MKKFLLSLFITAACLVQLNAQGVWTQKSDCGASARHDACGFSIGNKGYLTGGNDNGVNKKKDTWEYDQNADSWSQKADCGATGREKCASFTVGNKGYVVGGNDGSTTNKDCYEYDQAGNSWTKKADFGGTARDGACGFSIGTKGYVACGNDGSTSKECWEYDQAGDSWTKKADFGGNAREMCTGFSIGNKGYVGCGNNNSTKYKDFWEYDQAGDSWTKKADFGGTSRCAASGFSVNSSKKGYITCGDDGSVNYRNDCWEYDQNSDTWNQQADFAGTGRHRSASFCIRDKGYVTCGKDYNVTEKNDCWEFAPCNQWYQKSDFGGTARYNAFGFSIGNKGYFGCGLDGIAPFNKDVWEYDPSNDTWSQKADFGGGNRFSCYSFAFNATKKGYVGGGYDGTSFNKDLYEYDQLTNAWTKKSDYPGTERFAAASFTINDKAYVGSGTTNAFTLLKDWYEYNPTTDSWTSIADYPDLRTGAASFSIGNYGYVGSGDDNTPGLLKSFYKYDLANNTWSAIHDCSTISGTGRRGAVGFTLCNKGYIVNGLDGLGNNLKEFWEYDPNSDNWNQKTDYAGNASENSSAFVIGCKAYVGLGQKIGFSFTNEFYEYLSCCCSGSGGGVGGGSGGGLESKNIGDGIAKRILNYAKNNRSIVTDYSHALVATHNNIQTLGTATNLTLSKLMPDQSVLGMGYTAYVTTPTDITSLSNAVDVMSQDYVYQNENKAVAFVTKTMSACYSHTKPVCDRLKEASLLSLKQVTIQGMPFIVYELQQADGKVEFAISFTAGAANNGNAFNVQSIWLPYNISNDDVMYNFQVWATNTSTAKNLVSNILTKLSSVMPLVTSNTMNSVLPNAYIVSGNKTNKTLTLNINNNTTATTGYIELNVGQTEQSTSLNNTTIPVSLKPNGITTVTVDLKDYYEANVNLFVNNKQEDLVYLNDGPWAIDYNKTTTTINSFTVNNNNNINTNNTDFNLFRNVSVDATTADYVTLFKLTKGGGMAKDLSKYNQLTFSAKGSGASALKITIIKNSITNWQDQFNYIIPVDANEQNFSVDLSKFSSITGSTFNANDIVAVDFSFLVSTGAGTHLTATVSDAKFTNKPSVVNPQQVTSIKIDRNPTNGNFKLIYHATKTTKANFNFYDAETGVLLFSKTVNVNAGINNVPFVLNTIRSYSNMVVTVSGEGIATDNLKFVINKN